MSVDAATIARRREDVLSAITRAAANAGRHPGDIALMAVTKMQPVEAIAVAARAGIVRFGENRVQEGAAKIPLLSATFPGLEWRLIGPLQSNKARTALQWFGVIETLDRERLASRLDAMLEETGETRPVLLEVNVGGEASKAGVSPDELDRLCETALGCRHLEVRGLMTVPPYDDDPEKSRPYFRRLASLREGLSRRFGRPFPELSMGMSHDFAVAVEEGATEVRVGTALFGPRPTA
jgi:PLP dependent protein